MNECKCAARDKDMHERGCPEILPPADAIALLTRRVDALEAKVKSLSLSAYVPGLDDVGVRR